MYFSVMSSFVGEGIPANRQGVLSNLSGLFYVPLFWLLF